MQDEVFDNVALVGKSIKLRAAAGQVFIIITDGRRNAVGPVSAAVARELATSLAAMADRAEQIERDGGPSARFLVTVVGEESERPS